jgi:hypothetical protein
VAAVEEKSWEASGTNGGLHLVHLYCEAATALEAAQMATQRARAKYGATEDLRRWRFFVRERSTVGPTMEFRVDATGRVVQLDA